MDKSAERIEKATRAATMSLLLFGSLHALALAALFWQAAQPFNVRVGVATFACLVAYGAAWWVWRTAALPALILGLIAVLGSLARVFVPMELGVQLGVTVALTLLFAAPIVRAIVIVSRSP